MISLISSKSGPVRFTEIPGHIFLGETSSGEKIKMELMAKPDFQVERFNLRLSADDRLLFTEIPWSYTLIFIFGYSITLYLSPSLKREIHDRGSHLFHTENRSFEIRFQKDRDYSIVVVHYSEKLIKQNLEENAQAIRTRWEQQSPIFYYNRSLIAERKELEQLSLLWPAVAEEQVQNMLMDFLQEEGHCFQPSHLRSRDFETFYKERDELIMHVLDAEPISVLLQLAGIRQVPLFRKKLHQLYNLNIRDFITEKRMYWSLQLLKDPTLSIKEIAAMSGFASAFYFSRVFTHYFGRAPKYFRPEK